MRCGLLNNLEVEPNGRVAVGLPKEQQEKLRTDWRKGWTPNKEWASAEMIVSLVVASLP